MNDETRAYLDAMESEVMIRMDDTRRSCSSDIVPPTPR